MLQKPRAIMMSFLFFPNVETRLAPMVKGEADIGFDQQAHRCTRRLIEDIERPETHQNKSPQGRAIMLRTRPFANVKRGIRIEARLAKNAITGDSAKVVVAAHVLQKERFDSFSKIAGLAQKRASIEAVERQAEGDKFLEAGKSLIGKASLSHHMPQGIDDNGRIAQPMEKIIGVWIPGAKRRRGEHRPRQRPRYCIAASSISVVGSSHLPLHLMPGRLPSPARLVPSFYLLALSCMNHLHEIVGALHFRHELAQMRA